MTVTEQGKAKKQPYFIHPKDSSEPGSFDGIYERWHGTRSLPEDHERAWLWTAAIITTSATDDVGEIHDRMPMVIARDQWDDWLDPDVTKAGELHATMLPAMADGLARRYPAHVSTAASTSNAEQLDQNSSSRWIRAAEIPFPLARMQSGHPASCSEFAARGLPCDRCCAAPAPWTGGEDWSGHYRRPQAS